MNEQTVEQVATFANIQEATLRVMVAIVGEDIASKPESEMAADIAAMLNRKLQGVRA